MCGIFLLKSKKTQHSYNDTHLSFVVPLLLFSFCFKIMILISILLNFLTRTTKFAFKRLRKNRETNKFGYILTLIFKKFKKSNIKQWTFINIFAIICVALRKNALFSFFRLFQKILVVQYNMKVYRLNQLIIYIGNGTKRNKQEDSPYFCTYTH